MQIKKKTLYLPNDQCFGFPNMLFDKFQIFLGPNEIRLNRLKAVEKPIKKKGYILQRKYTYPLKYDIRMS